MLVVSMLIPIIIMILGCCLIVCVAQAKSFQMLHFLFFCNQLLNPSSQVGISNRMLSFQVFLLSETDLDDSTSSILSPSQPVCTEAAIISENLEFGWFRVVCCFSGNNFLRWKLVKLISSCLEQTAKNVDPFTMQLQVSTCM